MAFHIFLLVKRVGISKKTTNIAINHRKHLFFDSEFEKAVQETGIGTKRYTHKTTRPIERHTPSITTTLL